MIGLASQWVVPFISISLALSGLYFNLRRIRESKKEIQKQQETAIQELRSLIKRPLLSNRLTRGLVTASFIRSNAIVLSSKHSCGGVTVPMMVEAIRWVSLDLQEQFTGEQLKRRLEELNPVLMELDSSIPPLLSLAQSDPLAGYYYGQLFIAFLCVTVVLVSSVLFVIMRMPSFGLLAIGTVVLMGYLSYASNRAKLYYDRLSWPATEGNIDLRQSKQISVHWLTDFFFYMFLCSGEKSNFFWNAFAPLWEMPIIALMPRDFMEMHGYRFIAATDIRRSLNTAQSKLIQQSLRGEKPSDNDVHDVCELLDRLWVVTGDDSLKQKKEDWNSGRAFNGIHS